MYLAPSRAISNKSLPMEFHQELQTTNVYLFDEFEYDDDVFYSELKKQVLQLTAEDEEEVELYGGKNSDTVVAAQKRGLDNGPFGVARDGGHYNWPMNKEDFAAPAWIMNSWRTGNGNGTGTGVFIPQVVQSKKKNRPRKRKNERGRTYRRVEKI